MGPRGFDAEARRCEEGALQSRAVGFMSEAVDVLGLGNSLVDIIAHADDAYLVAQTW